MVFLLIVLTFVLIAIVLIQIGRVKELADALRGEEQAHFSNNRFSALAMVAFMVLFLVASIWSSWAYKNDMLWYGPHQSASEHGGELDSIFNVTLFFTGIVFIITQVLLFWYAYKYQHKKGVPAIFLAHDTKLEIVWTMIPAVVMSFLVIRGLFAWNSTMADLDPQFDKNVIEIEATGYQFAWAMRYPGPDKMLGTRNYKLITSANLLGQDFTDPKNHDDIVTSAPGDVIKVPKGVSVRVRITSRDVLHNFGLPHFRVKMDAIPGLPTSFVFKPTLTTEEYRANLAALDANGKPKYPEWHEPSDPNDPTSPPKWRKFNFELMCQELCGTGHYSMKRVIEVVSYKEWKDWMKDQKSYYFSSIRNTVDDPLAGKLLSSEIETRSKEFSTLVDSARVASAPEKRVIRLDYVTFETGSARLTKESAYELQNVINAMNKYPSMKVEVAGHTDNAGKAADNQKLSEDRAKSVFDFLVSKGINPARMTPKGYGQDKPVVANDSKENMAKNRRTEFQILSN